MPVSFKDILEALEFVSAGGMGEHQAFLCKQSGRVYWHSEFSDELDELPDDIEDSEKYVPIPDKRELDLGKPLVLDFARQFLPNDIDEVRRYSAEKAPTPNSRTCWIEGALSITGTSSRRRSKKKR